jgi:DNA-binding NarL/FixJ family response regulator
MKPLRIVVVDDHSIFRKGVRTSLDGQAGIEVIGEASNGDEAIQLAIHSKPDIILMDIAMPVCDGLKATRQIKSIEPDIRIVILTVSDTDEDLYEAIKSGALGYLQKDIEASELGPMMHRVANGEALISGLLAAKILQEFRGSEKEIEPPKGDLLTGREVEVLTLVANGCSNREIAEKLVISENTVKHHLSNILQKLHLKNRLQLAVYSLQQKPVNKSSEK